MDKLRRREDRIQAMKSARAVQLAAVTKQQTTLAALKAARQAAVRLAQEQKKDTKEKAKSKSKSRAEGAQVAVPAEKEIPLSVPHTTPATTVPETGRRTSLAGRRTSLTGRRMSGTQLKAGTTDDVVNGTFEKVGVTIYNPPKQFRCIFQHGAVLRNVPVTRKLCDAWNNVGLVDFGDIVLAKALHEDVSRSAHVHNITHPGIQQGGSYYELCSNARPVIPGSDFVPAELNSVQHQPGGWLPLLSADGLPLLEEVTDVVDAAVAAEMSAAGSETAGPVAVPAGFPGPITLAQPSEAADNGGLSSHSEHLMDVRRAIVTLVTAHDPDNASAEKAPGLLMKLLQDWEGKEIALLHALHKDYSTRRTGAGRTG